MLALERTEQLGTGGPTELVFGDYEVERARGIGLRKLQRVLRFGDLDVR
jgi:hypothetical protein